MAACSAPPGGSRTQALTGETHRREDEANAHSGMISFGAYGRDVMRSRVAFVVGMVICALSAMDAGLARLAHGQPADALKKAQAAFDKAQLDYLQGKYDDAAQGFVDA